MKIIFFTQVTDHKQNQAIIKELLKRGCTVRLVDCSIRDVRISTECNKIIIDGEEVLCSSYDGMLQRFWGFDYDFVEKLLLKFHNSGVPMLNPAPEIIATLSNIRTYDKFLEYGVPTPDTIPLTRELFEDPDHKAKVLTCLPFPYIIKRDKSCRGNDVWIANNEIELSKIIEDNFTPNEDFILQKYIPCKNTANEFIYNIRVLVLNHEVIGCHVTYADNPSAICVKGSTPGIANLIIELEDVTKQIKIEAINAARAVGLNLSRVDLIFDKNKRLLVLKVNSSPNLSHYEHHEDYIIHRIVDNFYRSVLAKFLPAVVKSSLPVPNKKPESPATTLDTIKGPEFN